MALPLRDKVKAVTIGIGGFLPKPNVMAKGIPATIWAASKRPSTTP